MTIELHIVTGEASLLAPKGLPPIELARTLGPAIGVVTADWLAPGIANDGHDFLLDGSEDRRVATMARTLAVDFGGRQAPCLVLRSLLAEGSRATAMLRALVSEMAVHDVGCRIVLHALMLPGRPDPTSSVQALRHELAALGLDAELAEPSVVEPKAGGHLEAVLQHNLLVAGLSVEVARRAKESGFAVSDPTRLAESCSQWLTLWSERGLSVPPVERGRPSGQVSEFLLNCLLTQGPEAPIVGAA